MKITEIAVSALRIPLHTPFTTARRTASTLESVLVNLQTDEGGTAYGEAPIVTAVTGETAASIKSAVCEYISPAILGKDIDALPLIIDNINRAMYGNPTAKSAVECAVYDLYARWMQKPLCAVLGSGTHLPTNDCTISVSEPDKMIADCLQAIGAGHRILKIKLGKTPETDGALLAQIWQAVIQASVSSPTTLDTLPLQWRVDANQGWTTKEAIRIIRRWEDARIPVEMVEQPVPAWDITGLRTVTAHCTTPIVADESIFTPQDAVRVLEARAADRVNIKLAKAGGLTAARAIADLCALYHIPCMLGCMLESRLGTSYAAHLAAAHDNITCIDLDGPLLCAADPFTGGPVFDGPRIRLTTDIGVGLYPSVPPSLS